MSIWGWRNLENSGANKSQNSGATRNNSLWLHFLRQETNTSLGIFSLDNRQILSFKKCPSKFCVQLAFFWQMTSSKVQRFPVVPTWNDNLFLLLLPAAVRLFCTFGHGEEPCRIGDRFSWTLESLSTYFSNIMRILGYPPAINATALPKKWKPLKKGHPVVNSSLRPSLLGETWHWGGWAPFDFHD